MKRFIGRNVNNFFERFVRLERFERIDRPNSSKRCGRSRRLRIRPQWR
jgi:hypothetical protein